MMHESTDDTKMKFTGRVFHILAVATGKAWLPKQTCWRMIL